MASSGKRKTTMAKLTRERRLMERRLDKQAKKEARKHSAEHHPVQASDSTPGATDQESQPTVDQG
jgi:hypothetical protein